MATNEPYVGELRFDWPTPCTVEVAEQATKKDNRSSLSYQLKTSRHAEGMMVSFADMTVNDVNGQAVPERQRRQLSAAYRLPDFIVDPHGAAIRLDGFDRFMSDLVAADSSFARLDTEGLRATLEESVKSRYWDSWVGFWADYGPVDEPRFETTVAVPVGQDVVDAHLVVESLPTAGDGLAVLRMTQTIEGPELTRAIGAVVTQFAGAEGPTPTSDVSGRRIVTVEITTEPLTLRPHTVTIRIDARLGSESQLEERHLSFDWASVKC